MGGETGILAHFPSYLTPRPEQRQLLLDIEANWNSYDVFVGIAPTAVGKTEIAVTIAEWQAAQHRSTTYAVPNNVILEQTHKRYPAYPVLRGQDNYRCETYHQSCRDTKADKGAFCKSCPYIAAKKLAKASGITFGNFYTYFSHKLYADTVIFDEAHQLIDMVADKKDIRLWSHLWNFPRDMKTVGDVLQWGQEALASRPDTKLARALTEIRRVRDGATIDYARGYYRGVPCTVLHIVPATKFCVPSGMWPEHKVRKLVMLSATTGLKDMEQLGLDNRRVLVLQCDSPIPADNRPFVYEPTYNLARKYERFALPILARKIEQLLDRHPDKGLIHIPYRLAEQLQELIQHPRLMWHDRDNKAKRLEAFQDSDPSQGRVLVASGLYEGVDLPYDAARWQLIAKVPYLSLGDSHIRQRQEQDPDGYDWAAIKSILQATGRIVRAADDRGTSYMCDNNFERLYRTDSRREQPMFPGYFRDAVRGIK